MSSLLHGEPRQPRKCSTRDCRYPGGPASARQNSGNDTSSSRRLPSSAAARRWTCRACSYENYAWRAFCHSCNQAAKSACPGDSGGGSLRRPAQRATFSEFLSAECDRLWGGSESLGSGFSQDRGAGSLKGLGCEPRKSRGSPRWQAGRCHRRGPTAEEVGAARAQRRDAVPQVDQGCPQNGNRGTGKRGHQARGSAELGGRSSTALVFDSAGDCGGKERRRREGAGSGNAAGETFTRGRLRWVCLSWIFCFFILDNVAAAVGSWTCGVAPRGRSNQVRGLVFQR